MTLFDAFRYDGKRVLVVAWVLRPLSWYRTPEPKSW
jgi:hypothetical protein